MREYFHRRRKEQPEVDIIERARKRARRHGIPFSLPRTALPIPKTCPVLGIPIHLSEGRSDNSPSLDRILPDHGYVPGNCRVISDKAKRLKSDRTHDEVLQRSLIGPPRLRSDYAKVARYMEREALLIQVRGKAAAAGPSAPKWASLASLLDRAFAGAGMKRPVPRAGSMGLLLTDHCR
jgi:hypothetical protein